MNADPASSVNVLNVVTYAVPAAANEPNCDRRSESHPDTESTKTRVLIFRSLRFMAEV